MAVKSLIEGRLLKFRKTGTLLAIKMVKRIKISNRRRRVAPIRIRTKFLFQTVGDRTRKSKVSSSLRVPRKRLICQMKSQSKI